MILILSQLHAQAFATGPAPMVVVLFDKDAISIDLEPNLAEAHPELVVEVRRYWRTGDTVIQENSAVTSATDAALPLLQMTLPRDQADGFYVEAVEATVVLADSDRAQPQFGRSRVERFWSVTGGTWTAISRREYSDAILAPRLQGDGFGGLEMVHDGTLSDRANPVMDEKTITPDMMDEIVEVHEGPMPPSNREDEK